MTLTVFNHRLDVVDIPESRFCFLVIWKPTENKFSVKGYQFLAMKFIGYLTHEGILSFKEVRKVIIRSKSGKFLFPSNYIDVKPDFLAPL